MSRCKFSSPPAHATVQPVAPIRRGRKVMPNDRCPCGSGKKVKKCCVHLEGSWDEPDATESGVRGLESGVTKESPQSEVRSPNSKSGVRGPESGVTKESPKSEVRSPAELPLRTPDTGLQTRRSDPGLQTRRSDTGLQPCSASPTSPAASASRPDASASSCASASCPASARAGSGSSPPSSSICSWCACAGRRGRTC